MLFPKRAAASRLYGEWNDDDYDVLCEGAVVGRIMNYGQHEDRTPIYGYEPTRDAAMAAFAKSWRRE